MEETQEVQAGEGKWVVVFRALLFLDGPAEEPANTFTLHPTSEAQFLPSRFVNSPLFEKALEAKLIMEVDPPARQSPFTRTVIPGIGGVLACETLQRPRWERSGLIKL